MPWFRVASDATRDEKLLRLRMRLGDLADAYVYRLWSHCARLRADGVFAGPEAFEIIEVAAEWRGDRGGLVAAMLAVGLLDNLAAGAVGVHEWATWQAAIVRRAEKDRVRKRKPGGLSVNPPVEPPQELHWNSSGASTPPPPAPPLEEEGEATPVEPPQELHWKRNVTGTNTAPTAAAAKPPAKASAGLDQQRFWRWSQGERQAVLGHTTLPDEQWTARQVNERLAFVSTIHPEVITQAYVRFLSDPVKQAKEPACPMWMFAQEWPKYADQVLRAESAGAP